MISRQPTLYRQVVKVTYIYLGPAADRFVARQISNHLSKQPDQLRRSDLPELIDWIRLAMGFLTEDDTIVEQYISQLQKLSMNSTNSGSAKHAHKSK
jgi:hypothetical protein